MDSVWTYAKGPNLAAPRVQSLMQEVIKELTRKSGLHLLGIFVGMFITWRVAVAFYNVWFHPLSKFPGPPHMAAFYLPYMYDTFICGNMHNTIRKLHQKYGPIVRVGPDHLAIDGSVGWPEVYGQKTGQEEFGKVPEFLFQGDTTALIAAPKDVHRRQRRQLAHAFSDSALRAQEGVMKQYVDLLMSRFAERADTGESFNIIKWFDFTTFDIIGHLYHSEPFHCLENNGYHPWVSAFFKGIRGDSYRRFLRHFPLAHEIVKRLRVLSDLNSSTDNRDYIMEKAQARIKQGDFAIEGYRDFIAFMLKKNRDGEFGFFEPEILASSPLVITAGSETTASSLSALVFYLGSNPVPYKRLTEEIRSAFSDEEEITLNSTQRLEYLHACIEEVLRVYPPVPETPPRQSPGGTIDGKWVPRGTTLTVFQMATYHNPKHWAEADSYLPERWLPKSHPLYDDKFKDDNRATFKPFSYGPRDCLGKNLAYSEMRLILARLLFGFDFELVPGQEGWHDALRTFLVWERMPLNIHLKKRSTTA
ncbi:cytochrome P450 [Trichoderma longibrachiatum]|uniref:Cytochrome P450 n=1 Tax=Trichoderma longibrachiatum ATCC 18648 TaxID=983965 RepID=A0A2T4C0D6_TRILO|nr:cytochrome P450 [Trichoderma longibrachiatum ATCC 18648]